MTRTTPTMKLFKSIFLALTLSTTSVSATTNENTYKNHLLLADTLREAGLKVYTNVEGECDNTYGFYLPISKVIVICQTNYNGNKQEVTWTNEDYDTLRHEAHHFVQDCVKDGNHDGELGLVYNDVKSLVMNNLPLKYTENVINQYKSKNADNETIILELEAFAVASMNDPLEQTRDVIRYCL